MLELFYQKIRSLHVRLRNIGSISFIPLLCPKFPLHLLVLWY